MTVLRESVEQQKKLMIERLVSQGVADGKEHTLSEKTITELLQEYGSFFKDFRTKLN